LPTCNICKFQVVDNSTETCPNCGEPLRRPENDDDVIESSSPEAEQSSGGHRSDPPSQALSADDDTLEICDPGEFLAGASNDGNLVSDKGAGAVLSGSVADADKPGEDTAEDDREKKPAGIQKLSEEQINSIRSSMLGDGYNGESEYVTPHDASSILHNLSPTKEGPDLQRQESGSKSDREIGSTAESSDQASGTPDNRDDVDPNMKMPKPVRSAPSRNIAYFHKNFIQLTGNVHPINGEELVIEDRHYILRPKRIKPQYTIGAFVILVAILLIIIGKQFISPTMPGSGTLVGVILDDSGRPLANGITLALPATGQSTVSDAFGFFRFNDIPTGTYVIRYSLDDGRTGEEQVSVASDDLTVLSMSTENAAIESTAGADPQENRTAARRPVEESRQSFRSATGRQSGAPSESRSAPVSPVTQKQYAALKLKTNVDGATLIVNGETLGRGDITYRKLGPGNHTARVVKDGYQPWKGKITLQPGETYTLSVSLQKTPVETTEREYTAEDFYQSGRSMMSKGDVDAAVADFTEAINMDPSMADAYFMRADAYSQTGKTIPAESDYIRAGEIYRTQKRYATALDAFNRAIEINDKSLPALLNRGDIYIIQENKGAALDDYQSAAKCDKNNFRANFELGKLYFSIGQHKDADKRLRKARDIDPSVPEVYHFMMLNYFARDDFNKVKKTYSDFKNRTSEDDVQAFKINPRFDAILRIVGEYERP